MCVLLLVLESHKCWSGIIGHYEWGRDVEWLEVSESCQSSGLAGPLGLLESGPGLY